MARYIPFSKRKQQAADAGKPLVYQYDKVPSALRKQVIMILQRALGSQLRDPYGGILHEYTVAMRYWSYINQLLCEELGVFRLAEHGTMPDEQACNFLLTADCDGFLDALELSLKVVNGATRTLGYDERQNAQIVEDADDAIDNINYRMQENSFGYVFVPSADAIVRIDSQYLHKDAVDRAFALLHDANFKGAEEEFAEAHREYREGHGKNAITKALNAFESTIKTICDLRGWHYEKTATSSALIKIVFEKGLLSTSYEGFFGALKSVLESGLPTVRNKSTASHGQGSQVVEVPPYVTGFALHLAASSIVLLVEANNNDTAP